MRFLHQRTITIKIITEEKKIVFLDFDLYQCIIVTYF
jgi:hypothetical protein